MCTGIVRRPGSGPGPSLTSKKPVDSVSTPNSLRRGAPVGERVRFNRLDRARADRHQAGADPLQEAWVMGDDDLGLGKSVQKRDEAVAGKRVEARRRFVKK